MVDEIDEEEEANKTKNKKRRLNYSMQEDFAVPMPLLKSSF